MKQSRLRRLLELIVLLQSGRGHNALALSTDLGVSRRTIFRDLDLLRQAGVPLEFDDGREQYYLGAEVLLPGTSFTPDEALSLLVLCHELGDSDGLPYLSAARRAALKIESSLPHALREYLHEIGNRIRIRPEPRSRLDGQSDHYRAIIDAISRGLCLRIRYDSLAEKAEILTKLSPYQVLFSRRSWYVIGRSSLHRGVRTFNLGRIRELSLLDETFKTPRGFSLDRFLRNAWHLMAEPGPDRHVVIRFEPMVARNVAEVMWHRTQQVDFQDDGSCLFSVEVSGLTEISWWILGYGDQATVLEPVELREKIAARVSKMAERYGCLPSTGRAE